MGPGAPFLFIFSFPLKSSGAATKTHPRAGVKKPKGGGYGKRREKKEKRKGEGGGGRAKLLRKALPKPFPRERGVREAPLPLGQKKSYQWFLDTGLREVFADVASIGDYAGNLELSFIDYSMDEKPKYDVEECKARDATYAAPMKVSVRLHNKETGEIKEQEIFMGDFP